jgi:uncharacterized protein
MELELNAHEARILGVLIEKALTTPDQYPLTLNALVNGCNQKSNRDPVVDFTEAEVTVGLTGLRVKGIAGCHVPVGSRVEKWSQGAAEKLSLDPPSLAVMAELLMRGAQQPGELRTRANRMAAIATQEALHATLAALQEASLVERLAPSPGSRAERWRQKLATVLHLDGDAPATSSAFVPATPPAPAPVMAAPKNDDRVTALEARVAALEARLTKLSNALGA